jgi:hypothetical protein
VQANFLTNPLTGWVGQSEIDACALPGDSGGPVVATATSTSVYAAGSLSAAVTYDQSGNQWLGPAQGQPRCGTSVGKPNKTYYAPLEPTLKQFNVVLATG